MDESSIACRLLRLLASGGTIERVLADLPMFKPHIEAVFERMKINGQCSAEEITLRAARLREVVIQKDQAINQYDWDLAASSRADECAIYGAFGLKAGSGFHISDMSVDEQIRELSVLLRDAKAG